MIEAGALCVRPRLFQEVEFYGILQKLRFSDRRSGDGLPRLRRRDNSRPRNRQADLPHLRLEKGLSPENIQSPPG